MKTYNLFLIFFSLIMISCSTSGKRESFENTDETDNSVSTNQEGAYFVALDEGDRFILVYDQYKIINKNNWNKYFLVKQTILVYNDTTKTGCIPDYWDVIGYYKDTVPELDVYQNELEYMSIEYRKVRILRVYKN